MNRAIDLLYLAKQSQIEILLNEDQLQVKLPRNGRIPENLLNEIKENKKLIIDFLNAHKRAEKQPQLINTIDKTLFKHIPLSFSQGRLFFIDSLEGTIPYHIPLILRLKGNLNRKAMEYALQNVVLRHEVLRTVIREEDHEAYQYVKEAHEWEFSIFGGSQYKENHNGLQQFIRQLTKEPFDLSKDYMLRAALIAIDPDDHVLVITIHHIAFDGWSVSVLVKEVTELYNASNQERPHILEPIQIQYTDYAIWQRQYLTGELLENKIGYWRNKLRGLVPLQLSTDFTRPAKQSSKGSTVDFSIDKQLSTALQELSQQQGTTIFMTLLAAFNVLLFRYSGQKDICVGSPISNRTLKELEVLIGFFVNTLALRNVVDSDQSFIDLLQQVKVTTLEGYTNQDVPFEKVVEEIVKERDMSRSPLFQVMFVLQNGQESSGIHLDNLNVEEESFEHATSKFDLSLNITHSVNGSQGGIEYCTDLFREETIVQMITHFKALLVAIVNNPQQAIGSLPMLNQQEINQLLVDFNDTASPYPADRTIIDLFEEQVKKTPAAIALVFEAEVLSYQQLNERSNQLANYLRRHGVKQETLVPICIERSLEMIIGILGILKAGAAYVPIDPAYPQERISFMLEDTGAKTIVTSHNNRPKLQVIKDIDIIELDNDWAVISKELTTNFPAKSEPHQLAYVIYTSGSTGRPKGVLIEHIGVVSLVKGINYVSLGEDNILLSTGSSSFDATTFEYWGMLLNGGQLILSTEEKLLETSLLKTAIKTSQVNMMWFTSSWFNQLVESDITVFEGLKTILVGGEKLSVHHIQKLQQTYPLIEIINGYGPTENTTFSLTYSIKDVLQNRSIPIGIPLSNRTAYVLSGEQQLAPIGVPGEICIGGAGLARGYLNRPELTGEKFIADPFSNEAGKRIYKTGDLGRWLPDGNIEYLGRKDDQVKVRGYRIELGEIEAVLMQSGLVSQAVIQAIEDSTGTKQLVGYVVPESSFDKQAIISFLSAGLPGYMVPALWLEMDRLPITPNGKIDRSALPDPYAGVLSTNEYVAPRNELETKLVGIWKKLLAVKELGVHDNFFELGGNSLLAMRVVSAIRRKLGVEVAIKNLFVHPTVSALSLHLKEFGSQSLLPSVELVTIKPEHIPLSFSQGRLFFIDSLEGTVPYHIPLILRLKGNLNRKALEYALQNIVLRHEVLRTVIREEDEEAYQYVKEAHEWEFPIFGGSQYKENDSGLQQFIGQLTKEPFDLSKDYMLRAALIAIDPDDHVLVITIHHIAFDGWSVSVLVKEFTELYNACNQERPPKLTMLQIQYADYAIWQRQYLTGELLENKIGYWRNKLRGLVPLQLSTDFTRPAIQSSKGSTVDFSIDEQLSTALQELSQQQGTTIFMTLLAAFNVLLFRYSGQKDICVGSPISNRTLEELEVLIGFFVNTLALRNVVDSDQSFIDLLQQVKSTTLEGYTNQDVPFEKVVEEIVKERDMSRSPLFQVMFVLQNAQESIGIHLDDVNVVEESFEHNTSKFDLSLNITHSVNGSQGGIEYCTDLFREETIVQMITHFKALLISIVNNPQQAIGSLPMLNQQEINQLLVDFNDTASPYPADKTIIDLFEEQVKKTPAAIALVFEAEVLSYQQLNERSNQLAHYLRGHGVKQETLVPICIERSLEMIIAILGILKAGAAYVPIDPAYPQERISFMLEDTGAKTMITSRNNRPKLQVIKDIDIIELDSDWAVISKELTTNLPAKSEPHQLAYVIYTSGSTGRPKGVLIEHIGVVSLVKGIDYMSLGSDNILLSTSSSSFDVTTFEYWSMLLNGGQLILCAEEKLLETRLLKIAIKTRQVNTMCFTSSWFNQLVESDITVFEGLKTIMVGGEKLSVHHIQKLQQIYPLIEIINGYGPTENTTCSLTYSIKDIPQNSSIPIGRPLSNRTAYILSGEQQLVPVGVPGEICVDGAGLARGYLNLPELTREKFIVNPFSNETGKRIYKTGDLGRWLPDGNIEYLGRMDNQVKVRGYRIELGEIETVLMQSGSVSQAVIQAIEDSTGAKQLVGYVVPESSFDKQAIISFLSDRLPDYMVPALWIELEELPITANGKIDTSALPAPVKVHLLTSEFIAPRNVVEEKLAVIWQKILKVDTIGMNDNFFSMGGHSLTALRVVSTIKNEMGVDLMIKQLFLNPTLGKLAAYIQGKANEYSLNASHFKSLVQIKKGTDKLPLYIVCGGGGTVFKFREFVELLNENQSVYGLEQPSEITSMKEFPKTVEGIAAAYINEILIQNPEGPYALSGHCLGGIIAYEMAKQLEASGREVKVLALFDTVIYEKAIHVEKTFKNFYQLPLILKRFVSKLRLKLDFEIHLFRKYPKHAIGYKVSKLRSLTNKLNQKMPKDEAFEVFKELEQNFIKATKKYLITPYDKEVIVFYAKDHYYFLDQGKNVLFKKSTLNDQTKNRWNQYVKSVSIYDVEGEHSTIFQADNSGEFAKILQQHLDKSIG